MVVLLRKTQYGLTVLRNILNRMTKSNVLIRNNKSIKKERREITTVFKWGNVDTPFARHIHVFNDINVDLVANKYMFRKIMKDNDLSIPDTTNDVDIGKAWIQEGHSLIVRPIYHHAGKHLYHVDNVDDLIVARNKIMGYCYISKYIRKVKEYRVFVAQGKVVWVASKIVDDLDVIAWNHEEGSSFQNVRFNDWDIEAVKLALKSINHIGLDFGAVDIIVDENGKSYLLEINSAPSFTSEYRIDCVAKTFDYMIDNVNRLLSNFEATNWRNFIHPAISDEAIFEREGHLDDSIT